MLGCWKQEVENQGRLLGGGEGQRQTDGKWKEGHSSPRLHRTLSATVWKTGQPVQTPFSGEEIGTGSRSGSGGSSAA